MSDENTFLDLIAKVQAGDEAGAAELYRRYLPAVRRAVRLQFYDARLRRLFDSDDICQSALASFFQGAAEGKYPLDTPEQLVKLLTTMARNKLTDKVRRQRARRRDHRQVEAGDVQERELVGRDPTPSQEVSAREMQHLMGRYLSAEERQLLELRSQGKDWAAIAEAVGSSPEAVRKKVARTRERILEQLGIKDEES